MPIAFRSSWRWSDSREKSSDDAFDDMSKMKFNMLVLEGVKEAEKIAKAAHTPVDSKGEYLRRKRRKSLPPLSSRSFYLCRMIEEELKDIDLDGSGKITICAHNVRAYPGEEKYIRDPRFHISIYYLEQEQIDALDKAVDEGTESVVIAGVLRNSLLDIARRSNCSEDIIRQIKNAFGRIDDSHFVREERIAKLTKRCGNTDLTAQVYRVLSENVGEGWYIKITDRKGNILSRETIGDGTRYVNRLGSRLYAKAEWRGDTFVIMERFGKVVFSISV